MTDPHTPFTHSPPYSSLQSEEPFSPRYYASCYCKSVQFEAQHDPVDAKICHCRVCQMIHGCPFQWAVLFHKQSIRFTKGVESLRFYNSKSHEQSHSLPCKLSCGQCGSYLADEGRTMFLAFGPAFVFPKLEEAEEESQTSQTSGEDAPDSGGPSPSSPWRNNIPDPFKPTCHIFYASRCLDIDDGLPKYDTHRPSRSGNKEV